MGECPVDGHGRGYSIINGLSEPHPASTADPEYTLSRRQHRFESGWGRHKQAPRPHPIAGAGSHADKPMPAAGHGPSTRVVCACPLPCRQTCSLDRRIPHVRQHLVAPHRAVRAGIGEHRLGLGADRISRRRLWRRARPGRGAAMVEGRRLSPVQRYPQQPAHEVPARRRRLAVPGTDQPRQRPDPRSAGAAHRLRA